MRVGRNRNQNKWRSVRSSAEALLSDEQRWAISCARAERWLEFLEFKRDFREEDVNRDERGRFSSGGGVGGGLGAGVESVSGGLGAGANGKKHENASQLLQMPKVSVASIVAKVPGAAERIKEVEAKLRQSTPSSALVSEGGFKNPDGSWTADREAMHRDKLAEVFTPEAVAAATPPPGEKPTLYILGGRGGSGKSWFTDPARGGPIDQTKTIVLNNDDFKEKLPEYQGWNAAMLHDESKYLGKAAEKIAMSKGLNTVIDGTMRSDQSKRIESYRKAGYKIEGYYMYLSPEASTERAIKRFMGPAGRYVPPDYTLNKSTTNEASFDKVKDKMDGWAIYDNSGKAPKLYARKSK